MEGGGIPSPAWITRVLSREYLAGATVDLQGDSSSTPEIYAGVQLTGAGHQFLAWWQEARGADPIPAANAVSPRALRQILPYIRYMSWEGPERLVFRIYGSALAEATGFDLTGVDLFGLGDYPTRQLDIARLKALHEMPCGVVMLREMRLRRQQEYLRAGDHADRTGRRWQSAHHRHHRSRRGRGRYLDEEAQNGPGAGTETRGFHRYGTWRA